METSNGNLNASKKLMIFIIGLLWFSVYVYTPILSPYCKGLGISYTAVGTILSSYGLVQLIMRIPIGIFSDVIGRRKPIIVGGMIIGLISNIGFYFSTSQILLILCRGGAGLAASCWAIYMTMYAGYFRKEEQGDAIGRSNSMMLFGQVAATFLGGIIAQYFAEKLTFVIAAAVGVIGIFFCLKIYEPKEAETRRTLTISKLTGLLKNRDLLFYSACGILMQLAIYTGAYGFVPNILRDLGADNFMLGLVSACASLPGVLSSYLSGTFFKNKVGQDNTVMMSFVLFAFTLYATILTQSILWILVFTALSGFAKGLLQPMLTSLSVNDVTSELRSTAVAFFQSVYGIGMTLGPLLAGYFADTYSMKVSFMVMGSITLTGTFFVMIYKHIKNKEAA